MKVKVYWVPFPGSAPEFVLDPYGVSVISKNTISEEKNGFKQTILIWIDNEDIYHHGQYYDFLEGNRSHPISKYVFIIFAICACDCRSNFP